MSHASVFTGAAAQGTAAPMRYFSPDRPELFANTERPEPLCLLEVSGLCWTAWEVLVGWAPQNKVNNNLIII
jgi:hypothetical protein